MLLRSSILKNTNTQWQWFLVLVLTSFLISKDVHVVSGQEKYGSYVTLQTRLGHLLGTVEQIHINKLQWPPSGNDVPSPSDNISQYYSFKGIRYTEPIQRFQDPVVKRPSSGFVNATVSGSPCSQWTTHDDPPELIGNEDCLFANIYIPTRRRNPNDLLKIMVFIHGGAFIKNIHLDLVPTPLLLKENAMIVTFNFRVSFFGYLSTGTSDLPGNYGSLDQIALLKWLQIYARDFGGDPNHVTIFGDTTGAVMIHYLLLSKLASGLFHRAIFVSGCAFCESYFSPNPLEIAIKVGSLLGCQNHNPPQLVACIRSFSAAEIMATEKSLVTQWILPIVLAPASDAKSRPPHLQFLPNIPENLPVVNKVPMITGVTKDDGITPFLMLSGNYTSHQLNDLVFIQNVIQPNYLNLLMRHRPNTSRQLFIQELVKKVMLQYAEDFEANPLATLILILSDLRRNNCHRKMLENLCSNSIPSVYAYLFTHHDQGVSPTAIQSFVDDFHKAGINHPILDTGATVAEETRYLQQEIPDAATPDNPLNNFIRNRLLSEMMTTIWTDFANDIEPEVTTTGPLFTNWLKWEPICKAYNYTDPDYPLYEISLNNHRIFKNYRLKVLDFWWNIHLETIGGSR